MKIIKWTELKTAEGPFYDVLRDDASPFQKDPRHLGCAPKSFLNLISLLREQRKVDDGRDLQDIAEELIAELKQNDELSVKINDISDYVSQSSHFFDTLIFCFNFKATAPDVGQSILLRRISQGQVALLFLEVPEEGEEAKCQPNHLAVLHSDGKDIFLDGLRIDWETLINVAYFSPTNMAWIFGLHPRATKRG